MTTSRPERLRQASKSKITWILYECAIWKQPRKPYNLIALQPFPPSNRLSFTAIHNNFQSSYVPIGFVNMQNVYQLSHEGNPVFYYIYKNVLCCLFFKIYMGRVFLKKVMKQLFSYFFSVFFYDLHILLTFELHDQCNNMI